jgi:hypothetical protein
VGEYDPLADQFALFGSSDQIEVSFSEVEELVGPFPGAARIFRHWWRDDTGPIAMAWRSTGWSVRSVDLQSERIVFTRDSPAVSSGALEAEQSPARSPRYLTELHLPLIITMFLLCISFSAVGFGLRPGTDQPPIVPHARIQLYVYQQQSLSTAPVDPTSVSVDETMIQKTPSTVETEIDILGSFSHDGVGKWNLITSASGVPPYACPDPYDYLGTAHPDPYVIRNGDLTVDGQPATSEAIANFAGHRLAKAAANTLALQGQAPASVSTRKLTDLGKVDLCWSRDAPLAFDGEYASAALPTVAVGSAGSLATVSAVVTRSLYFENPSQDNQPLTAEYSLQAGSLPTSTDPEGWHWSSGSGRLIQITALNISQSQHEAFLGFLSGVLFGIAGSALILLLQELLEPIRRRDRGSI